MQFSKKPSIWILPILSAAFVCCVIWVFVDSARIQGKVSSSVEAVSKLTAVNQELLTVASDVTYLSTIDAKKTLATFEDIPQEITIPHREEIFQFLNRIPDNTNPKSYFKASQMIDRDILSLRIALSG